MRSHASPQARLHAMAVLRALGWLERSEAIAMVEDPHSGVAKFALQISGASKWLDDRELSKAARSRQASDSPLFAFECLRWLIADGSKENVQGIAALMKVHGDDSWFQRLVGTLDEKSVDAVLAELFREDKPATKGSGYSEHTLDGLLPMASSTYRQELFRSVEQQSKERPDWHFILATSLIGGQGTGLQSVAMGSIVEEARKIVRDPTTAVRRRGLALQLLAAQSAERSGQDAALFLDLLQRGTPQEMKQIALEGLKNGKDPSIADRIMRDWKEFSPEDHATLLVALAESKVWQPRLLAALESGLMQVSDLDPRTIEYLKWLPNPNIAKQIEKLLGSQSKSGDEIARYLSAMGGSSNLEKGKALFERHCQLCHTEQNGQRSIGPALEGFANWTDTMWLTAILDPNRAVEARYRRLSLLTDDGQVLVGLMRSETDNELTIAMADGKSVTLSKSSLERMEASDRSLMPEGFDRFLPPDQMPDLIAFLRHRAQKKSDEVTPK